ncbi:MAG: hypothetical protein R3E52_17060 [Burkholderiaceae bacterium]
MPTLSLDAAVAITGISRSTLWRRAGDGALTKGDKDARGRATLALGEVLGLLRATGGVALAADEVAALQRADAGDARAQADMGALFYVAGAERAALYWLNEAAAQGNGDAMQWLGVAYAAPGGKTAEQQAQDDNLAVMWIARAAAQGQAVAQRQMAGLLPARRG